MASIPPPPPPPPADFTPAPPPPTAAATTTSAPPAASDSQQATAVTNQGNDWNKPWNTSVVRQNAKQWSLAGDTALLLSLKEMSKDMISRTHSLGKEIDSLAASIKSCEVSTNNAFNEFITLANNQFVENRVYDEDVSQSAGEGNSTENPSKKEKTKEEVEGELIPKISQAVSLGLNVLETAYEKLEVNIDDGDSDDDEPYQGEPMLELKDPYVLRSLPVVIGSQAFHQNDNVGLIDVPSDDDESDHGSLSESEEEDAGKGVEAESSDYSYSDSDEQTTQTSNRRPVLATQASSSDSESEEDDDLFGTARRPSKRVQLSSESENEDEAVPTPVSAAPLDFASELAKKIGVPAAPGAPAASVDSEKSKTRKSESKPSSATNKETVKTKKTKKPAFDDDDLFGAPESDDDGGLFSSRGGLFDSGGGLFDNATQDDGGLFDDVADVDESHMRSQKKKKKPVSSSDDEEEPVVPVKAKPAKAKQEPVKAPASVSHDLFGDNSDEEDWGGKSKESSVIKPVEPSKPAKTHGGLFSSTDSEEEDSLFDKPTATKQASPENKKKMPAGAVSMFGGNSNPLAAALQKRAGAKLSSDESASEEEKEDTPTLQSEKAPRKASVASGLFGSDGEGDSESISYRKDSDIKRATKKPAGGVSLFGGVDLFAKERTVSKSDSLFGDDDANTERAPSPVTKKPVKKEPVKKEPAKKEPAKNELVREVPAKKEPSKTVTTTQKVGKGLFSDSDDDGDLFSSKPAVATTKQQSSGKPVITKKSTVSKGLFSDSDSDDNAVGILPPITKTAQGSTGVSQSASSKLDSAKPASSQGLFEDSDNDDDMFAAKPAPNTSHISKPDATSKPEAVNKPPIIPPPANSSLFSESDEEDSPLPVSKPVTSSKTTVSKPATQTPSKTAASMFDDSDDDDDDLFSGKKTVSPPTSRDIKPSTNKSNPLENKSVDDLLPKETVSEVTKSGTNQASSLFDNTSDNSDTDEHIVDVAPKSKAKDEILDEPPAPVQPKRPAGAVSMFGGMDPSALLKKKSPNEVSQKPAITPSTEPETAKTVQSSDPLQLPSSVTIKSPAVKRLPANIGIDPLAMMPGATPSKKATIGINPLAMIPGATPPKKEPVPQAIGFDIPAENTKVLHNFNKSRAKVQQKRKPPSRYSKKGEKALAPAEPTTIPEPTDSIDTHIPPVSSSLQTSHSQAAKTPSVDPFDDSDTDDLFSSKPVPPLHDPKPDGDNNPSSASVTPNFIDSSLKSSDRLLPPSDVKTLTNLDSDDDDLFTKPGALIAKKDNAISNGEVKTQEITNNGIKIEPNKSPSPVLEEPPPLDGYSSPEPIEHKTADPFALGDSDDDIFAVKPAKQSSSKKTVGDIFDDEDLFTSTKPAKKKPVLDLDDDDLFASKPVKPKRQKAFTKDEDLFGGDDIFADINIKSKEKKVRAPAGKKSLPTKKVTLDDDMDDLFADLGSTKGKTKKVDLDDDDLFGDPLGGF
ncbi:WASH complex subunit 2-like isoform X2 [Watersipora subatra]|uniref:WASH complex subunit 2-like isoform X2 n=1 Tax=Watersipora subatra TaxID=2589382 RepID=UPI00355C9A35